MEAASLGFIFILLLVPYFLPTIIAAIRKKQNLLAIFVLNIFGFTFILWIIALVWACTKDKSNVIVIEKG